MDEVLLLERIRDLAAREAHRPALRVDGRAIDFGELVSAATTICERLCAVGVGPEDVVATVLPRGGHAIVAVLGIWMSGAAYAPTDPAWPQRRLDLVLGGASACIVQGADEPGADGDPVPAMPGEAGVRISRLDGDRSRRRTGNPDGRHLAYVIQTSGSTGTPNAVGAEFGALDNYATYLHDLVTARVALPDGDLRVLLSAHPTFDASLRPLLLLAAGATLVVAPDLKEGSWSDLVDTVVVDEVTVLSGVPSWYAGLLGAGFELGASRVRLAFIGGEAVPNGVVRQLRTGGCAVAVQYGPTETTVAATGAILTDDDFAEPPIGDAIPGARVALYRTDELTPVPAGEPGDLYVGGVGVTRGYLQNPRLTAERFVPDPAGPPGSRMFRSGDLARQLPGGGYSFLGRRDDQVKISGRRIELGEVSSVANRHPAVAQSVAFVLHDGANPRLAACYVANGSAGDSGLDESLRDHLAGELPDYLVPALIRRVDALPVTDRGKVDVTALVTAGDTVAPAGAEALDAVEYRLLAIVHDTLGAPCTLDDDFLEIGGGSLDALAVLARIREEFGVRIRLRDFFGARSLRAVRGLIGDAQ